MKRPALLVIGGLVALSAVAASMELTPEEKAHCAAEGGCVFATMQAINAHLKEAYDAGMKRGQVVCRGGA